MRSAWLLAFTAAAACGNDHADPGPDATTVARASWYQDVAPILSAHCMSCHQSGGIAPFSLTDYDSAKENAARALTQVDQGTMPPFDAREESDCTPRFGWKDDPRLSAADRATLHAWVEDGYALGTEAAIAPPAGTALPHISKTLAPTAAFVSQGTRDQFVCTVLDPGATGLQWLTGLQVRPGNPVVVHHVVLTEVQAGPDQDAIVAAHGVGQPFDCSTMATPGQFVMAIWTPGNQPVETPDELAIPITAGAKIVMQIHYHPAGTVNAPDTTAVDLRTSSVWPQKMYLIAAFGNEADSPALLADPDDRSPSPEFRVPAGKADHTEHMRRAVPDLGGLTGVSVYSVNPHMHLVGTHIAGRIERPSARGSDPQTECLANGGWNFDWQRTYIYDAPLASLPGVQAGDVVDVQCHWNNTIQNPFVQRMLHDAGLGAQPVDILLGEQTTNEMCLEIFGLAVDAPQPHVGADYRIPTLGRLPRIY